MGSKFLGRIADIPFIKVDYITTDPDYIYFVSHIHTDHLSGLNKTTPLYCTEVTAQFLHTKFDIPKINTKILSESQIITFKSYKLEVQTISANHCPGAVMFLFKFKNIKVLYTGDTRLDGEYLSKNKEYFERLTLDHLYFDNTFSSSRFIEIPTINESLQCFVRFVRKFPPSTQFFIDLLFIGHELLFEFIYKTFKQKIHVEADYLLQYRMIPCTLISHLNLSDIMTVDPKETKFHFCKAINCARLFKFHDCKAGCAHGNVIIKPCCMSFRGSLKFDQNRYLQRLRQYKENLPNFESNIKKKCIVKSRDDSRHHYSLLLSLHSSTIEIDTFLSLVKCDQKNMYTMIEFNDFVHGKQDFYNEEEERHFLTLDTTYSLDYVLSSCPAIDEKSDDELIIIE